MADANIRAVITAKDEASSVVQGFGLSFGQMAGAVAVGQFALQAVEKVASEVVDVFKDAIGTTQDLGTATLKMERNFGLTAEEGSGLIAVFKRFGLGVDDASRAFGIFQKHLLDVKDSESVGVKAISVLGVATKDASGNLRDMNDVLLDVADKFKNGVVPSSERAGVAMQLFGRSGQSLIPVLMQGSDGIKALEKHAKDMGVVLSQDNVEAVRKNMVATNDLNEAWTGLQLKLGNALLPIITKMITAFNDWWVSVGGFDGLLQRFKPQIDFVTNAVKAMQKVWQQVVDIWNTVLLPALQLLWTMFVTQLLPALKQFWEQNKNWLIPALEALAILVGGALLIALLALIGAAYVVVSVLTAIVNAVNWVQKAFTDSQHAVYNWAVNVGGWLANLWINILAGFTFFRNGLLQWASNTVDGIVSFFQQLPGRIAGAVGQAGNAVGHALHIPGFASGVTNFSGGLALVGEQGPEVVALPRGSSVIPNNQIGSVTGGGGGTVNITVQAGAFMGSQQDARKYAMQILDSLKDVAASKGTTVGGLI